MKLKIEGKLRDGFFEWLKDKKHHIWTFGSTPKEKREFGYSIYLQGIFEHLPQSAQFGLLQEYADTLGYHISAQPNVFFKGGFAWNTNGVVESAVSRPEAQAAAIEKLNEIINKDER